MSGIAMGTEYNHLTLDERCRLRGLMEMGLGAGEIAGRLGRHRATIHREIARNRCAWEYRPDNADPARLGLDGQYLWALQLPAAVSILIAGLMMTIASRP